ncbi:MAG: aspartate aminotransferase family protein [Bdellovibrio sp.]|nr:aspartate aminotransferase family protein [Bdellovibrio sp.]
MKKNRAGGKSTHHLDHDQILKLFGQHINPSKVRILKSAGLDLVEGKREGPYVWDVSGNRFIDCITGAGSFNVGRRNPEIINALKEALDDYDLGGFLFFSEAKVQLAEKLASISPQGLLKCVTFGCGGGESIDFAIKLSRGSTLRPTVITADRGYHGHTGFALSGIGRDAYRKPFGPLMPEFIRVPYGDLDALKKVINENTACVLLEPIQGEGGIIIPPESYFPGVRKLCDENGALLIVDEIQTGWGRTGKLFCCEHYGIVPDILCVGKSMGGGLYPITAALYKEELQDFIFANPFIHFSTFGGSDLGCKVALATIDYIEKNQLWLNAEKMGMIFQQGFEKLKLQYPQILAEYRRKGLMMGLQYASEHMGPRMSFELAKRGVIAVFSANDPRVMRFMPSLVIQKEDVLFVLDALDKSMGAISKGVSHG